MNGWIERGVLLSVIGALTVLLISEGRTQVRLERQVPVDAQALYDHMAAGQSPQLIDMRPLTDESNDDVGGYEDARVPKSVPFPGCDPSKTPNEALQRIKYGAPTVLITLDGAQADLEKCAVLQRVRLLDGGMMAWSEAGFPEDEGQYQPPKVGGGGGCL